MEENKQMMLLHLRDALIWSRTGVSDLQLDPGGKTVTIRYIDGYWKRVNVDADSGVAMMRDILRTIN